MPPKPVVYVQSKPASTAAKAPECIRVSKEAVDRISELQPIGEARLVERIKAVCAEEPYQVTAANSAAPSQAQQSHTSAVTAGHR